MKKGSSLVLFAASIAVILLAVVFTALINTTRQKSPQGDTRARASEVSSMVFRGNFTEYDSETGTLTVTNLRFDDSKESLGTWTITPPKSFNPARVRTGSSLRIVANPVTFQVATKTLTATEIK